MSKNTPPAVHSPPDARDHAGAFIAHMEQLADLRRNMNDSDPLWVWTSHEELILRMVGEPTCVDELTLPDGVEAGEVRDCYRNAYLLSFANPRFTYAEGFAMGAGFFPMNHAWCIDNETGSIVDPTWVNFTGRGTTTYMGLPFADSFVGGLVSECRLPSVFENDFTRKGRAQRCGLVLDSAGLVVDFGDPPPF